MQHNYLKKQAPARASKLRHAWKVKQEKVGITSFTSNKVLSFLVNGKLGKHLYHLMRSSAKQKNADIYPSYNNFIEAKQCCYPTKESFTVAEAKLQDLLGHTILHIEVHEIVLSSVAGKSIQKIVSVFKLGFALDIVSTNKDSPANMMTVICI